MRFFIILVFSLFHFVAVSAIWSVGPSQTYSNPSDVVGLVSVGDTVEIDAGTYSGNFCIWNTRKRRTSNHGDLIDRKQSKLSGHRL